MTPDEFLARLAKLQATYGQLSPEHLGSLMTDVLNGGPARARECLQALQMRRDHATQAASTIEKHALVWQKAVDQMRARGPEATLGDVLHLFSSDEKRMLAASQNPQDFVREIGGAGLAKFEEDLRAALN